LNSSLRDTEQPRAGAEPASGAARLIPDGLDATLVLLRHGQTQFIVDGLFQGALESQLTALGEAQARLAGRKLAAPASAPELPIPGSPPYSVTHSPLGRARRSAELAIAEMNAAGVTTPPIRADAGFMEIAQGGWEGLTAAEIGERYGDSLALWRRWPERFHAPGGESLPQVRSRAAAALERLLTDLAVASTPGTHDRSQVLGYAEGHPTERRWALVVAHGGVFRVVVCLLLDLPMHHFWNFDFGLGAITVIEIRAGRAVLRTFNFESHLDAAAGEAAALPEPRPEGAL
jgi:broad specificity phosphatase PhoE